MLFPGSRPPSDLPRPGGFGAGIILLPHPLRDGSGTDRNRMADDADLKRARDVLSCVSMIRDALAWWSAQMLDLVPARLTRPDPSEAGALLVEPYPAANGLGPGVRLCIRQHGAETEFASLPLSPDPVAVGDPESGAPAIDAGDAAAFDRAVSAAREQDRGMPVLLRLPWDAALRRDVVLPLAAEAGLDRVLAYEMDRLTPFGATETFYAFLVTGRDRAAGRLFLRLTLLPRAPLQPLLSLLSAGGAEAQAIEISPPAAGSGALRIPLAHEASASARRQRLLLRAAFAGCALLLVLAVLLPFALQQAGLVAADRRINRLQPQVRAVQALQGRIAGGSAGAMLVQAERARLGDALAVMAAMTKVLPDDSYLTDLTLRRGQMTVSGQSPSAARLIPAISADPNFTAPAFTAPVTRIEGQGQELFSIRAGVAH